MVYMYVQHLNDIMIYVHMNKKQDMQFGISCFCYKDLLNVHKSELYAIALLVMHVWSAVVIVTATE